MRTISHLRPRTNTFQAVFRVRSLCAYAIHKFFQERDFVYVHTPLITGSDCEGAGEMFQVTTLDLEHLPKTAEGAVDYSQDLIRRQVLPYPVSSMERHTLRHLEIFIHLDRHSVLRIRTRHVMQRSSGW